MIKLKIVNTEVTRPDGGPWYSEDKSLERTLNIIAIPGNVRGYYPDIQEGLVALVDEAYKGVVVLEISNKKRRAPIIEDPVY